MGIIRLAGSIVLFLFGGIAFLFAFLALTLTPYSLTTGIRVLPDWHWLFLMGLSFVIPGVLVIKWKKWFRDLPDPRIEADQNSASAFCENCGNPLNPKAKFCGRCGNRI